jgi:hypothetical protein
VSVHRAKNHVAPVAEKFNTFNTFNTFDTFAIFATFNPALEDPMLVHRQAPRARSVSERAFPTPHPPSPGSTGEGVGGEGMSLR